MWLNYMKCSQGSSHIRWLNGGQTDVSRISFIVHGEGVTISEICPWDKKPPVPTEQEFGWAPELVQTFYTNEINLLPLAGIEPQNTQTIATHYTAYTIWAPTNILCVYHILHFLLHIHATAINLG